MRKIIVCMPNGGLCNRMRAIASLQVLADSFDKKPIVIVLWIRNDDLNASFDSIFQSIPFHVISIKRNYFIRKCNKFFRTTSFFERTPAKDDNFCEKFKNKNLFIDTCYKIAPCNDFSFFKVTNRVQSFINRQINKNTIGIHIRRTDNEKSILYSPTELFVQKIEAHLASSPDANFYLATDDSLEEHRLKSLFPGKILTYQKRSLDRNSKEGIEDAVVDLKNLSNCGMIWGSFYSSFSETAAEWGNKPFELIVSNVETK